jgi:ribonuclease III
VGPKRRATATGRNAWIREAERAIGQRFRNPTLLRAALTHPSVGPEGRTFERLAFLGDAVLGLLVGLHLYRTFADLGPGGLTQLRASIVNRRTLAEAATDCGLPALLRLGRSEEPAGRQRAALLAATFEAVVAAFFLDRGLPAATRFLNRHLRRLHHPDIAFDAKSRLQRLLQAATKSLPRYVLLHVTGPPHARRFQVAVKIGGRLLGRGTGGSRREAEESAARTALASLHGDPKILR